eukprot:UN08571
MVVAFSLFDNTYSLFISLLFLGVHPPSSIGRIELRHYNLNQVCCITHS